MASFVKTKPDSGGGKTCEKAQLATSHSFTKENLGRTGKKDLLIYGAGGKSQKITQKIHAGRGSETIWEMSHYALNINTTFQTP